jgi:cellulose synthase/poly-beta-1,6-N-acetylglucosamine synthase-like glycosyltransferase
MLLAAVGVCGLAIRRDRSDSAVHSFGIIIPAHNEEHTIQEALISCRALDYPAEKHAVYVIADNCSDRTADVASSSGLQCFVRQDKSRRGKGFALQWALPQVIAAGHDAVLVLDADCRIDPNALRVFDRHLKTGHRVIQATCAVANPDDSPLTYVLALANTLENRLFYAPKSVLGLAVFLCGTGMVIHRDVLTRHPWHAESIVEDAEYTCQLLRNGVRVYFAPETRVLSRFPVAREELEIQRARWVGGGLRLGKTLGLRLLWEGLTTGRPRLLDAGWTIFILNRPLVIGQFVLASGAAAMSCWLAPGPCASLLMMTVVAVLSLYALYCAAGVLLLGVTWKRIVNIARAPAVVARYVWLAIRVIFHGAPTAWNRTARPHELRESE